MSTWTLEFTPTLTQTRCVGMGILWVWVQVVLQIPTGDPCSCLYMPHTGPVWLYFLQTCLPQLCRPVVMVQHGTLQQASVLKILAKAPSAWHPVAGNCAEDFWPRPPWHGTLWQASVPSVLKSSPVRFFCLFWCNRTETGLKNSTKVCNCNRNHMQLVVTGFSHNRLQTGRKPVWTMNTGKYSTNFHTIYLLSAHCWLVCSVYGTGSNLFPSAHVKLLCITGIYLPCLWQVFIFICLLM